GDHRVGQRVRQRDSATRKATRRAQALSSFARVTSAYVDTSFLLAVVFAEPSSAGLRRVLNRHERVVSSDLIVAECLSAAERENFACTAMAAALQPIGLVLPSRSLAPEMTRVLDEAYLRGAD